MTSHKPIRTAAVLGAGVMGAQIAAHLANAGLQVHLLDIAPKEGKKNAIVQGAFKKTTKMKPQPFFTKGVQKRITLGNFDEHFDRLSDVDWIIEVIIERLDIKQSLMERIEGVAREDTIVSTNTSGLPINEISAGRSDSFKSRFLGTHFFNPPRYLKLLEIIPGPDTDAAVVDRLKWFGRVHLGKGVVIAKDRPNFIGNRIGVYSIARVVEEFTSGRFSIEEIDALTGTLTGRPKSATFRTADVVGLDTLRHVISNLYDAVPDDERRETFKVPEVLNKLVEAERFGAKSKEGFYKKVGKDILSVDPETLEYTEAKEKDLPELRTIKDAGGLPKRLVALYESEGRSGDFFRRTTLDILAYSATRIPEISDSPADVDDAIRWGFGYRVGPFETWDILGFERVYEDLKKAEIELPDWVHDMAKAKVDSFYQGVGADAKVYVPGQKAYVALDRPADEWGLGLIKSDEKKTIWSNSDSALLDVGDDVALFEFRSKANSLGTDLMAGLFEALERVENGPYRGMVIGNEGTNFSVGANLGEVAMGVAMGQMDEVEKMVAKFQEAMQRVRYSPKPIVVAPHQRVLGGGCELTMASCQPVAASETYMGLVELGVGLIPAGTGTMHMAWWAAEQSPTDFPSHIQSFVRKAFETIAMAKVALSAHEAKELGFLPESATIVMNESRRFHAAKAEVVRLSDVGYVPPPARNAIKVVGSAGRAQFEAALHQFEAGRQVSEYDHHLGSKLAWVLTGGAVTGAAEVSEEYLIDLEREAFMSLLGEEKTQERIQSILTTGKPLRN